MSDVEDFEDEKGFDYEEDEYGGLKNVAILLVDVGPSMFDEKELFKLCFSAIYDVMYGMLLQAPRRNLSVCFIQNEDLIFTSLNDNLLKSCKKVQELLKENIAQLRNKYERKSAPSLRFTFSECLKQIKDLNRINPHIILLTDNDDPHEGDVDDNLAAVDVSLGLKDSNVKLIVLPLKENFDYELFYGTILKSVNDVPLDFEDNIEVYDTAEEINKIITFIIKNKRRVRRYYFTLYPKDDTNNIGFWVQMRYLVKEQNLYTNANISRTTKNPLKLESKLDADPNKYTTFGKYRIDFDKADFKSMKLQMEVGLKLLYVSDKSRISAHYQAHRNLIMQADEAKTDSENPKKLNLFTDMWYYAKNNNKYIICAYHPIGSRSIPLFVEFTPDIFQNKPCFVGQRFVNCEEIGDYPQNEDDKEDISYYISPNDRELSKVCTMIDRLKVEKFSPEMYHNYEYETKAAIIKAQLLDTEVRSVKDSFPSNEDVTEKMGGVGDMICHSLGQIFTVAEAPQPKRQRKQ